MNDLFSYPKGLWCSVSECWNPDGGLAYDSPVPAWTNLPPGCQQPTINTALTSNETLTITTRKNPGNYAVWRWPTADLTVGSAWALVSSTSNLAAGNYVSDKQGAIPPGTNIIAVGTGKIQLSNTATASVKGDLLIVQACVPYAYTAAQIHSRPAFLYGYFETRAKIPLRGNYTWPSFWMWGANSPNTYREIDVFEFGDKKIRDNVAMN